MNEASADSEASDCSPPSPPPAYYLVTSFIAEGDVSDYTPAVVNQMRNLFADEAGVARSQCTVEVEPASVEITVTIYATSAEELTTVETNLEDVLESAETVTTFLETLDITVTSNPITATSLDSSGDDNSLALGLGLGLGLGVPLLAVIIALVVMKGGGGMSMSGVTKADKKAGGVEMNPTSAV